MDFSSTNSHHPQLTIRIYMRTGFIMISVLCTVLCTETPHPAWQADVTLDTFFGGLSLNI